jgi:hypothetical protein
MYPSSGGSFGQSVERRYSEFTNFPDEVNVMPLLLLRLLPSSLWLSGAVPESEPTILNQGHILMEVMTQCCILSPILCNVLCMIGWSLCYRCLCCYLGCPLESGKTTDVESYSQGCMCEWVTRVYCLLLSSPDPGGYRWPPTFSNWLKNVNVYAIIIVLCISIDKSIIRTRSLRNTYSQETQHLSWETL